MQLEIITAGLETLLIKNNYSLKTIKLYSREWSKIAKFLEKTYSDTQFDMSRGLKYLEAQYGIISLANKQQLPQQRVQMIRIVHMLEDYRIHKCLTRRYYASKNQIVLNRTFSILHENFNQFLSSSELSTATQKHYFRITEIFLDYLSQLNVEDISQLNLGICDGYLKTLSGYSFKTIEQKVCGLRYFIRYLFSTGQIKLDFSSKIILPRVSKNAPIPSTWTADELKAILSAVDRNTPSGKRDYAMLLLACGLGMRLGDIKNLRFSNIDWQNKQIHIIQHKTQKPLSLPLPGVVGWALIDYIKNARPNYNQTDLIFIKHIPPFDELSESNHMHQVLQKYIRKAGIDTRKNKRSGFHSLRHTAASMLLEEEVPLPVITQILGHSSPDITSIYLKTDMAKIRECVIGSEDFWYE